MKKRRCWRYTCEFCKKSGCSGGAIRDHEARCFGNPNRRCTMCDAQWPLPELVALFDGLTQENEAEKTQAVEVAADHCPACVVSAYRQLMPRPMMEVECYRAGDESEPTGSMSVPIFITFNYKEKAAEYMAEKRAEERGYL